MQIRPIPPTVRDILSVPKFGTGIGFARMQELLEPLLSSEWGQRFTTIRVTGTNGKGSVVAMTHAILAALSVNCGRFISPHLINFHERILIGGREIRDDEIERAYSWVRERVQAASAGDAFGSFELLTAVCLRSFFENDVGLGVVEAGIGGRYDTTRLLPGHLVALTSVGLEHTELLGKTEELIAHDKLDLCPDGGTVVSVRRDPELWRRIRAYCRVRRITLIDAMDFCKIECLGTDARDVAFGMTLRVGWDDTSFEAFLPLVGTHQIENAAVAISLVRLWIKSFLPETSDETLVAGIKTGLGQVSWPGRLECISRSPRVFIDVGHSPDACARLAESVKAVLGDQPILLVTGVSSNKAVKEILRLLVPLGHTILCTRAHHNGEQVERIAAIVRELAPAAPLVQADTIEEAAALARRLAESNGMTVLVAGGLFLAIEFRVAWDGGDPTQLRFF